MKSHEWPGGRVERSQLPRPFFVRRGSSSKPDRAFGSLSAAERYAEAGSSIFFDTRPGCGLLVRHV